MIRRKTLSYFRNKNWLLLLLIILFLPTVSVKAQIYNERGQRYFKVFGADFLLDNGRINDSQASKILRYVEKSYNESKITSDINIIWRDIDDIYDGGKYHGEIILTIFKTYLNIAFDRYHNKSLGFSGNLRRFNNGNGDLIDNYAQASTYGEFYNNTTLGSTGKKQYYVKWTTRYRVLGRFPEMNYWVHDQSGQKEYAYNAHEAKLIAEQYVTRNMIYMSAYTSKNNLKSMLTHVERTVRLDDKIYTSGNFDNLIIAILNQHSTTKSQYGEKIAYTFYKNISEMLYGYIYSADKKEELRKKTLNMRILANFGSKKTKSF